MPAELSQSVMRCQGAARQERRVVRDLLDLAAGVGQMRADGPLFVQRYRAFLDLSFQLPYPHRNRGSPSSLGSA